MLRSISLKANPGNRTLEVVLWNIVVPLANREYPSSQYLDIWSLSRRIQFKSGELFRRDTGFRSRLTDKGSSHCTPKFREKQNPNKHDYYGKMASRTRMFLFFIIFSGRTFQHTQSDRLSALSLVLPRPLLQSSLPTHQRGRICGAASCSAYSCVTSVDSVRPNYFA